MLESYIRTGDGKDYVDVDCVREALGIKEDENIFLAIKKLKEERDELREERDNLKDNLRITENALKTVKKLGLLESVDYQYAKAARAELAHLYKTVLGKEKLDRDLSPHEVMKAILEQVEKLKKENESLVGEAQTLVYGNKWLREFRDSVAKAMGMDYPTTNNFIVEQVQQTRESYEKLQKDYTELGEAYSSVLKWNNSYAEVRRLLGVSADADAETMISAVKLLRDKDPMNLQKQNDDLIAGYNKLMSYKIQIEKELHKKDLKLSDSERRRKMWMVRYESEHKRANGEHKRAEGCFNDIAALKTQVSHLMRERDTMANEEVGLQSLKNAVRKLQEEKTKVITALGQDIWDDCLK